MFIKSPRVASSRISQIDFKMWTFFPEDAVLSLQLLHPLVRALRHLGLGTESAVFPGGGHRRRRGFPSNRGRRQPHYTCGCTLDCFFRFILIWGTARRGLTWWRCLLIMILTVTLGLFLLRGVAVMTSAEQRLEFHHGRFVRLQNPRATENG